MILYYIIWKEERKNRSPLFLITSRAMNRFVLSRSLSLFLWLSFILATSNQQMAKRITIVVCLPTSGLNLHSFSVIAFALVSVYNKAEFKTASLLLWRAGLFKRKPESAFNTLLVLILAPSESNLLLVLWLYFILSKALAVVCKAP